MKKLNPKIFREYDIRGYVGIDLNEEFAHLLGRAYGELVAEHSLNNIAIGWDCRNSSEPYARALAEGVASQGINVTLTGMGPTPQLYYAVFSKNLGGGIQVTGSHNPSDMNGFKICLGKDTISGPAIQDLRSRMERLLEENTKAQQAGTTTEEPIQSDYCAYLTNNSKPTMGSRKLKIVVDAGNGVGGMVGPQILRDLGAEVIELYCEPDGNFPNHHPDPTVMENLTALISKVKSERADFGIGWDGDADRIGVVDEEGKVVFGDMLLLIYATAIMQKENRATVIGDVKCSSILFEQLDNIGANPIMWKTGHSLIKKKLKEENADLAGEMSGHIFFKNRYFGYDDAIYASCRLAEIVSNHKGPFSELLRSVPKTYSTPEIRLDCPEEIKFSVASKAQTAFPEYKTNTIDGVRIEFEKGWGLVRASNTQPALVMRFEADSSENLKKYQSLVEERIAGIQDELK